MIYTLSRSDGQPSRPFVIAFCFCEEFPLHTKMDGFFYPPHPPTSHLTQRSLQDAELLHAVLLIKETPINVSVTRSKVGLVLNSEPV